MKQDGSLWSLEPSLLRENKWDWEMRYLKIPEYKEEELSNVSPVLLAIPVSQATSCIYCNLATKETPWEHTTSDLEEQISGELLEYLVNIRPPANLCSESD